MPKRAVSRMIVGNRRIMKGGALENEVKNVWSSKPNKYHARHDGDSDLRSKCHTPVVRTHTTLPIRIPILGDLAFVPLNPSAPGQNCVRIESRLEQDELPGQICA